MKTSTEKSKATFEAYKNLTGDDASYYFQITD